ncbi:GntR family transcriptional regulator [Nonomuraea aridisoli]|uniref:GntR family transcriptional regulator n=1 Tax=Nonomuraea aridisoli TaxID=2070368 RepID=A0A2W2E744_9ACTN|nr:GntR family transcriptional regulator [Nonomuraea aridisoli]PZG18373.1 GntR family transcriptional regulator [Nonomuraea aridisoli]
MALGRFATANRSRTAHEYVLTTLRSAILGGTLKGGTRLVQAELAAELGVSTTPVREALRDLATEGLVVMDPHKGAVVRPLDIAEVREIYELRMTLEPLMVRRMIASVGDAQLAEAEQLQQAMETETDLGAWVDLNRRFHAIFSELEDGSRLAGILAGLRDSAAPYVSLSLEARPLQVPEANAEHKQLIVLYRDGDEAAILDLTLQHLASTLAAIEQAHDAGLIG